MTGGTEREERRLARVVPHAITFFQARFQLARIDGSAAVGATFGAAFMQVAEINGAQALDRNEAEEAIRAMAFEDES